MYKKCQQYIFRNFTVNKEHHIVIYKCAVILLILLNNAAANEENDQQLSCGFRKIMFRKFPEKFLVRNMLLMFSIFLQNVIGYNVFPRLFALM